MEEYLLENLYSPGNNRCVLKKIEEEKSKGQLHILYNHYQQTFGFNQNFVLPYYDEENDKETLIIVLNNPEDVENITNKHIKKTPYLKPLLYDSIISTTSCEHWRDQRQDFQQAFSVNENLIKLIPISEQRSKFCVSLLENKLRFPEDTVMNFDLYEFLLNETLAQLQLALFGFSNNFEKETNSKIREVFRGKNLKYARNYGFSVLNEIHKAKGPLSKAMTNRESEFKSKKEEFGNALTFTFAGHDTTANTLTWLIFELCRQPEYYNRFQNEVDVFWKNKQRKSNLDIEYSDFKNLPFMTRCIMETLRLWTPIPNGTSRELIEEDFVTGKNGNKILVKKGTYVQIPNWTRHRNPLLWGNDCDIFNPDRDFKEDEIWNDSVIASYNPCSNRFSPFTYGPRDCIGKNFSQIEMRIILLYLFKNFTFSVSTDQLYKFSDIDKSINKATLGPRSIKNSKLTDTDMGLFVNYKNRQGHNLSKL
jgi:hypothetical protein